MDFFNFRGKVAVRVAVLLVLFCYALGMGSPRGGISQSSPTGHYQLLTAALLNGHTYLPLKPDPRLAKLANPYAGAQGIPRLHDASYFKDRYYLYFGTAPVVTFLGPWTILTGTYLNDLPVVVAFAALGFLSCALLWVRAVRRFVPSLGEGGIALGVLMVGLGNYVVFLLPYGAVYEMAILCAYACLSTALFFSYRSIVSRTWRQSAAWLFLSSVVWGLSVAARPNFAVSLPVLGLTACALCWRFGKGSPIFWRVAVGLLAAAVVPSAAIGAGLAAYNYARFGNFAEFGVTYQFAGSDMHGVKVFGLGNLIPNLRDYLFTPSLYTRYFPFVQAPGGIFGLLPWAPFCLLALLSPLICWRTRYGRADLSLLCFVVTAVPLVNLTTLSVLAFANDRYLVDVVPYLVLSALIVSAGALQQLAGSKRLRKLCAVIVAGTAAFTLAHCLLLTLSRIQNNKTIARIAWMMDWPVYAVEKNAGTRFGPLEAEIRLRDARAGTREPLVAAGHSRDVLFLERRDEGKVRFGFFHLGTISPLSDDIPMEVGKSYRLKLDVGFMYPPAEHPIFDDFSASAVSAMRRRVEVTVDEKKVYETASAFYRTDPSLLLIGSNPKELGTTARLNGALTDIRRLGLPAGGKARGRAKTGPVRLTLTFPRFTAAIGEPLVSTGGVQNGDLVYVTYVGPGKIRFGHDSSAFGGATNTRVVTFDPAKEHTVDVITAPLMHPSDAEQVGQLQIVFDGETLINTRRRFGPSPPDSVTFGFNEASASAAAANFTGPKLEISEPPARSSAGTTATSWGALKLIVRFPAGREKRSEPLIVSGVPGKGNFVYAIYSDPTHVQVGYDHWGKFALLSEPIPVDYDTPATVEVSYGSLYPSVDDPWWTSHPELTPKTLKENLEVRINGMVALSGPTESYPALPASVTIGRNSIGGSSCDPAFLGEIQAVERILPAR